MECCLAREMTLEVTEVNFVQKIWIWSILNGGHLGFAVQTLCPKYKMATWVKNVPYGT